jgi:hypothetical protein
MAPKKWPDVIPQHDKDLLQWASALQVLYKPESLKIGILEAIDVTFRINITLTLHLLPSACKAQNKHPTLDQSSARITYFQFQLNVRETGCCCGHAFVVPSHGS